MSEDFESFDVAAEPVEPEALSADLAEGLWVDDAKIQAVNPARDEAEARLLAAPPSTVRAAATEDDAFGVGNVIGVGIAEKLQGGIPTGELAVAVYVKEKLPARLLSSEVLVPESIGGVATDVQAVGEISAHMFTARLRPAPAGVSIGNCNMIMAGTLGCLVGRSNQLFVLSNNHVLALVNASPLTTANPQPGRLDGGSCPGDVIARLAQFVPITFSAGSCNTVDAAIARTSPELVDRRILRPSGVRQAVMAPTVQPVLNTQVQKSGRTTQYRRGLIDAINVTIDVSYAPLGGLARFCRQFRIKGTTGIFSDRGDSGSLITTFPQNKAVGLLFAGNAAGNVTFALILHYAPPPGVAGARERPPEQGECGL